MFNIKCLSESITRIFEKNTFKITSEIGKWK